MFFRHFDSHVMIFLRLNIFIILYTCTVTIFPILMVKSKIQGLVPHI